MSTRLVPFEVHSTSGTLTDGTQIEIDRASLSSVQGDDSQDIANELERLYGIVSRIQSESTNQDRPLNTFDSSLILTSANLGEHINRNNIYVASNDQRVDVTPPPEADLAGQYPAIFEFSHFGGTQRFDSGSDPNNTIRIVRPPDYSADDPSTFIRRGSETGANLVFAELHRGDTAVLSKQDADSPWVVIESSADPRTSILPNGVFKFNDRVVTFSYETQEAITLLVVLACIPRVEAMHLLLVALELLPHLHLAEQLTQVKLLLQRSITLACYSTKNNDDWLIIRDAGDGELTIQELRFLAQVEETDTFSDVRLETRSDVNNVRVWLSPIYSRPCPVYYSRH